MALPAGRIIDKYGKRKLIVPMMLLTPLLLIPWHSYVLWDLAVLVVAMGTVNAFLMPGFQSIVADYTPRGYRSGVTSAIGGGRFIIDIRRARARG